MNNKLGRKKTSPQKFPRWRLMLSPTLFTRSGALTPSSRTKLPNASNPMAHGPFGKFLHKLSALRRVFLSEENVSKVRIALVTARNAPAHERIIRTLRAWETPADEAHFVGGIQRPPF